MGEVFAGRYELVDPIGRGGVGEVWRAWDHRRRRYVACKVLLQRDAHSLLRFVREQALRIDHPYVLAPTSWAADDDKVLFTMDLVCGGSLAHLIGDYGALPPRLVITLLDQLLAGLTAVHAEGVVHRDIKPANLLLEATGTGQPHLRLSDFGIAVRTGDARLTETNYVVGTPGYFAPEQLFGAEPDFPQDLFAVGLVALYMLTGQKPDSEALVDTYASGGFPAAPDGVPHALWQVVASLLNPDPQARFRTATGVRKALAAAREMLPEASPDEETVEVFDHLGPLPEGFGPDGPVRPPGSDGSNRLLGAAPPGSRGAGPGVGTGGAYGGGPDTGHGTGQGTGYGTGQGTGHGTGQGTGQGTGHGTGQHSGQHPQPHTGQHAAPYPAQPMGQHTGQHAEPGTGQGPGYSAVHDPGQHTGPSTGHSVGHSPGQSTGQSTGRGTGHDTGHHAAHGTGHDGGPGTGHGPGPGQGPGPDTGGQGTGPRTGGDVPTGSGPVSGTPSGHGSGRPPSMSETGSFVLAPPDPGQQPGFRGHGQQGQVPGPQIPGSGPGFVPGQAASGPGQAGSPVSGGVTRPYTSGYPANVPSHRQARRPGPPMKIVVSLLIASALCFAVGIWALATG